MMDHEKAMHFIAQAVINIDCGLTTIEKNSRVYNAMVALINEELARRPAADDAPDFEKFKQRVEKRLATRGEDACIDGHPRCSGYWGGPCTRANAD
jgi:hypothetical protein